jgi:hypothetical protein
MNDKSAVVIANQIIISKSYTMCPLIPVEQMQQTIKKGLTTFKSCKPSISMVGDTGFEPVTSTG